MLVDKCIEWTKSKDSCGYGILQYRGKTNRIHRVTWIEAFGVIPKNIVIRHLCNNPACYNLNHLASGTYSDNARDRSKARRGYQEKKTKCKYGHEYTESNTSKVISVSRRKGTYGNVYAGRSCRTCKNRRQREYLNRKHGKV